jgi:Tfp pilus assembly protein PilP
MEIAPRVLSLAVALVFVFASPFVVRAAPQAPAPTPTPPPVSSSQEAAAPASAPKATPATPAPHATPPTATPPAAAPAAAGPELEPQGYTYRPEGRRDPFTSLLMRGSQTRPTLGARAAGLAGLETSEVTLKGTIASQGGFVGILQGADTKTYIVRAGDRLLDGTIRTITQDSMVVTQQVTDPLSLEKQREVRKVLRQTEEAK